MSEALLGVLIGGVLSGLGTWITIAIQHKRWVLETRLARLNAKRERLEAAYEKTLKQLQEGMTEGSYSSNMMSDIDFLFPEVVSKAFEDFMAEEDKTDIKLKHHYYDIARAMKQSLKAMDEQIDSLVLGKPAA